MKCLLPIVVLTAFAIDQVAMAQTDAPAPILPDSLHWVSPPNLPGLQGAWVLGSDTNPGPYILRVKLARGAQIPPHTHPDERSTTVLSGTIYVGYGEAVDESNVVALPAGAVYVAPANVPHYVWARDGDAMYQEAGVGPTGTTFTTQ